MTTNRKGPLNNPFMAHFQSATYVEKAVTWLNENYPGGKKRAA